LQARGGRRSANGVMKGADYRLPARAARPFGRSGAGTAARSA
jgi:hypothetical protein